MTRLVTSQAMQTIDRRAQEEFGIPSLALMEGAGLLAWQQLTRDLDLGRSRPDPRLCFVAGKGNNGGDALVMARYAIGDGYASVVVLAAPITELGEQAAMHARILRNLGVSMSEWGDDAAGDAVESADIIVDGLSGTGISGALRAPLDAICAAVNASRASVVSVDAPSGLSEEWRPGMPIVHAEWTFTMGLPKTCLYAPQARLSCGTIRMTPVSFPRALLDDPTIPGELLEPRDLSRLIAPLQPGAYKHRRGLVSVFGGTIGTTGAAVLTAEGAHRCRAGLVTIHADAEVYPIVASAVRSVMVQRLDPEAIESIRADALAIGPGWGTGSERAELLRRLVAQGPRGVIDADGLNLLAQAPGIALSDAWVLTPHPGELARLLGRDSAAVSGDFVGSVVECARERRAIVIGKSHTTVIARPDGRYAIVDGMNPALGTGGSGDVLTGAVAGLLAGGADPWDAARAAVLAHQEAGRRLRERVGLFLAEELPAELGRIVDVRPQPR